MKTGEIVNHCGLYCTECCSSEVELYKLQVFPGCPKCLQQTIWDCVELEVLALCEAA